VAHPHKKYVMIGVAFAALMLALIIGSALSRGQQGTKTLTQAEYKAEMNAKLVELHDTAKANPDDIRARNALADMLYYLERFDEAEQVWLASLEMNPNQPMVWSIVGETRIKLDKSVGYPAGAIAAFEEALKRDPKDDRARFFMAMHAANQGQFDAALVTLRDLSGSAPPESMTKTAAERGILEIEAKRPR
jgi:cytochrome c-type biogenesis protein CcmH